jgi:hypothetical protein
MLDRTIETEPIADAGAGLTEAELAVIRDGAPGRGDGPPAVQF